MVCLHDVSRRDAVLLNANSGGPLCVLCWLQDTELAGYPIAKGTAVAANLYAMHRCVPNLCMLEMLRALLVGTTC